MLFGLGEITKPLWPARPLAAIYVRAGGQQNSRTAEQDGPELPGAGDRGAERSRSGDSISRRHSRRTSRADATDRQLGVLDRRVPFALRLRQRSHRPASTCSCHAHLCLPSPAVSRTLSLASQLPASGSQDQPGPAWIGERNDHYLQREDAVPCRGHAKRLK